MLRGLYKKIKYRIQTSVSTHSTVRVAIAVTDTVNFLFQFHTQLKFILPQTGDFFFFWIFTSFLVCLFPLSLSRQHQFLCYTGDKNINKTIFKHSFPDHCSVVAQIYWTSLSQLTFCLGLLSHIRPALSHLSWFVLMPST